MKNGAEPQLKTIVETAIAIQTTIVYKTAMENGADQQWKTIVVPVTLTQAMIVPWQSSCIQQHPMGIWVAVLGRMPSVQLPKMSIQAWLATRPTPWFAQALQMKPSISRKTSEFQEQLPFIQQKETHWQPIGKGLWMGWT